MKGKECIHVIIVFYFLQSKTYSTITVTLSEPAVTNGIIRKYSVIVNNTVVSLLCFTKIFFHVN
jgi:hypothetical protein